MNLSQLAKKGNTSITQLNGKTIVTLYRTNILIATPDHIILNNGGWATPTTKRRMNQALKALGIPARVFQKDFDWFVKEPGNPAKPFEGNSITLKL